MDVGEHGNAEPLANARDQVEPAVDPGTAEGIAALTVRLVVGGFEDISDAEAGGDFRSLAADARGDLLGFEHARPRDEEERRVSSDRNCPD